MPQPPEDDAKVRLSMGEINDRLLAGDYPP